MFISAKKEAYFFRGTLFLAMLTVFILTLMKQANLPEISLNDKIAHLLSFFILAFLADFSFSASKFKLTKTLLLLGFGIAIETAQYFTSWRMAEWLDVIADLLGVGFYWILAPVVVKLAFWRK